VRVGGSTSPRPRHTPTNTLSLLSPLSISLTHPLSPSVFLHGLVRGVAAVQLEEAKGIAPSHGAHHVQGELYRGVCVSFGAPNHHLPQHRGEFVIVHVQTIKDAIAVKLRY
jgi:hypothetical protein